MLSDLLYRFRSIARRAAVEEEMDTELRFHFDQHVAKSVARGLSTAEAMRLARIEFGGLDSVREECRDERGVQFMENFIQDFRYALRTLQKAPGFAMVALLTLALGIGANAAIFSVVYGVLLAPLPYNDASRLMVLNEQTPRIGSVSVSYPNFQDWREQSKSIPLMAFVEQDGWNLVGGTQPEVAVGEDVSPNYLSVLGVRPILGRDFTASEEKAGTPRVALMSYAMWQSHFGGDPGVVGKTITLDGKSCTIIGVLPAGFRSINKVDLMIPIGVWATGNDGATSRGSRGDSVVVGQLAPGVSLEQARTEMVGIARRLAIQYPLENDTFTAELAPIRVYFSSNLRTVVLVLAAAVIFVLLIACANVANLLLMRGARRSREIALRIALGAGRRRVIAQMLTESFVLALVGGIVGVALAYELVPALVRLIPTSLLNGATVQLNLAVLMFSAGVVCLSAVIFGLAPAARLTQPDVQGSLKESGRSTSASAHQAKLRDVLAIAEVAVALLLLTGTGLMLKSFYRLLAVDPGFRTERLLTLKISLTGPTYQTGAAITGFWQQVLERVRTVPGVDSVAVGTAVPMTASHDRADITIEGMAMPTPGNYPHPDCHVVSGSYGAVLGMKLERGRWLEDRDDDHTVPVGMINRRLAQKYFSGTDPIGKRFMFGHANKEKNPKWITIVGVVGDTSLYGLQNPSRMEVYQPYRQQARDTWMSW